MWDITSIEMAGSWDPIAILLAGPQKVHNLLVEGRQIVRDGILTTVDLPLAIERQNSRVGALLE